jgi:hypothetical protein
MKKFTTICFTIMAPLFLSASAGQALAATLVTLDGSPNLTGSPGDVVGWGLVVTTDAGVFPLFTGSQFVPDPSPVGNYSDYLASSFLFVPELANLTIPFNQAISTGAGQFDIGISAIPGSAVLGTLSVFWDEYNVSPDDPAFDSSLDLIGTGNTATFDVSVSVWGAQTPEPSALWLMMPGLALLATGRAFRRVGVAVAGVLFAATGFAQDYPYLTKDQQDALTILRNPHGLTGADKRDSVVPHGLCHPDSDSTIITGCCGAPGINGCTSLIGSNPNDKYCMLPSDNRLRIDGFSGATQCNFSPPNSCFPGVEDSIATNNLGGPENVTFLFTSDIHFFRSYPPDAQIMQVGNLNAYPNSGRTWFYTGEPVGTPAGLVVGGDIGLDASSGNLGAFRLMYEKGQLPASLQYPLFFGLGNHEISGQTDEHGAHRMFSYLTNRMTCKGVNLDQSSGNYSWDWGKLHLVMLNTWAGDQNSNYAHHSNGLSWLVEDLEKHVGTSGRPVVLFQHYDFSFFSFYGDKPCPSNQTPCPADSCHPHCVPDPGASTAFWAPDDATAFLNIIAPYNVLGIFAGHTHTHEVNRLDNTDYATIAAADGHPITPDRLLDVFTNGSNLGSSGDFIAVRYTDSGNAPGGSYVDVQSVSWDQNGNINYNLGTYNGNLPACRKRADSRFSDITSQIHLEVTPGSQNSVLVAQLSNPNHVPLPAEMALRVVGNPIVNGSYVHYCGMRPAISAVADAAYIQLSPQQVADLSNPGRQVIVTVQFHGQAPDTSMSGFAVVGVIPVTAGAAAPTSQDVPIGNQTSPFTTKITLFGAPGASFNLVGRYDPLGSSSAAQTWVTAFSSTGGASFDSSGQATVTVTIDPNSFLALGTGQSAITFFATNALGLNVTSRLVVHRAAWSDPSMFNLSVTSASPAQIPETLTLHGPPNTVFTLSPTYQPLWSGKAPVGQSWIEAITGSPCTGAALCLDANGNATVSFNVDTAKLLAVNAPNAAGFIQASNAPGAPPFSLAVAVVATMPTSAHLQVTANPAIPGPYDPAHGSPAVFTAVLSVPNSIQFARSQPTGLFTLSDATLDSSGRVVYKSLVSTGLVNSACTFGLVTPWPVNTVVFGGLLPTCPSYDRSGGMFLSFQLPLGMHHFVVDYAGDVNYPPLTSPVFDYLVTTTPTSISALPGGGGQSTLIGTSFTQPFQAKVLANLLPLPGVVVTFDVPATGAGGAFSGGALSVSALTDANGVATSPVFTANRTAGTYTVTASVGGLAASAGFTLTNTNPAAPLLTVTLGGKSGTYASRIWTVQVADTQSPASKLQISGITLTQAGGPVCTPSIQTAFPIALGDLGVGASASAPVMIDFSTCTPASRFTVNVTAHSNGGAYQRTTTIGNQFP